MGLNKFKRFSKCVVCLFLSSPDDLFLFPPPSLLPTLCFPSSFRKRRGGLALQSSHMSQRRAHAHSDMHRLDCIETVRLCKQLDYFCPLVTYGIFIVPRKLCFCEGKVAQRPSGRLAFFCSFFWRKRTVQQYVYIVHCVFCSAREYE